jgi:hypothetical protein
MTETTPTRLATIRDTLRAVFVHHAPTDAELRSVAAALAVPYVELWAVAAEVVERPRLTRADVEAWSRSGPAPAPAARAPGGVHGRIVASLFRTAVEALERLLTYARLQAEDMDRTPPGGGNGSRS